MTPGGVGSCGGTGANPTGDLQSRLIAAAAAVIAENVEPLSALDRAIGDGDHGINLNRGFSALAAAREQLAAEPLGCALQNAGTMLVMKVGGASGPLYGSFLMAMGKTLGDAAPTPERVVAMVDAGVAAVKARGRSDAGEKTMLDVLVPVSDALRKGAVAGVARTELVDAVLRAADQGLEATRDLAATKGRASFLGRRSVGTLDPGAQSSCLLVHAVCRVIMEDAK